MAGPDTILTAALARGVGTGAQCVVHRAGVRVVDVALGHAAPRGPDVTPDTRFDLASVTKVGTALLAAHLVGQGALRWDTRARAVIARAPDVDLAALLGHRSGLPPWQPCFDVARADPRCAGLWPDAVGGHDRAIARRLTLHAALAVPPGAPVRAYSDIGFLVLGAVLEAAAGASLDVLWDRAVARPLGLAAGFRRLSTAPPDPSIPATGVLRPREPAPGQEGAYTTGPQHPAIVPGQVDDDHAWACDGVAGHAGLFASARDVARLGDALLADAEGAELIAPAHAIAPLLAPDRPDLLPLRTLGLDTVAPTGSSAGTRLGRGPRGGVGHLGFTGTSLWIDLDARVVVALHTNRTFPSRTAVGPIRALRPALHDAVWAALDLP